MGTSAVPADSEEYEYEEVEVEVEDDEEEVTEEEEAAEKLLRDKLISGSSGEETQGDSQVQFDLEKNKEHVYSANPQQLYKTKSYTTSSAPSRPALKASSCSANPTTPSTTTTTSSSSSTANATTLWAPTNLAVALENSKSNEAEEVGDSTEVLPPLASASDSDPLPPSLPATNSSTEAKTNGDAKTVRMVPFSFLIHYKTKFGESLYLTGNLKELGNWDTERAIEMYWNLGHYWRADVEVPAGSYLKFKFFVKDTTVYPPTVAYEPSPNHHHAVPTEKEIETGGNPHPLILCTWAHPLPRALRNAPEAHEPEIPPEVKERLDREMREFRALRFNLKLENMKREKELTSSIDRVFAYRKSAMWSSDFSSCGFDRDDPILVMDVGTENLRLGFAGDADPKVVAPSIVGSKKSGLTETFMVIDPSTSHGSHVNRKLYSYRQPIHKGIVENWEDMELMWKYYIFEEKALLREHSKVPVFLSESVFNPKYNREKTLSVLFESLALPSVSICNQEVLGLHASTPTGKSITGLVINSGADTTQIVPVYEGAALRHLAVQSNMGGKLLTKRLCEYFHIGDKDWLAEYEKNERMKRALKFLPRDEVDACRRLTIRGSSAYASVNASSDGFMDKERYLIPEVLFTPEESGWSGKGIQEGVLKVLSSCDPELRQQMANNIVLMGGNSMIEGFPERLFEELNRVLPSEIPDFSVFARPDRANQVWLGGSLMTSQPQTPQLFISKSLYEECGASIVHRMCHF